MKSLISLIVLITSLQGFSADKVPTFDKGGFTLYGSENYQPTGACDTGSRLILDSGDIMGNFVYLRDFVSGMCRLYVFPNERIYRNLSVTLDTCNSKIISASRVTERGVQSIEVIDHRLRICDDLVPANIIVTESMNKESQTLYSADF